MACHLIPQSWRVIAARHLIAQICGIMLDVPLILRHFAMALLVERRRTGSTGRIALTGNLFRLMNAEEQRHYRPAPRALSEMPA